MTISANVAEADLASVTVGQSATVTFPALPGVTATAKVTAIAPTGTTSNSIVTYPTTITLDSIPSGLRLGQTANVSITTKSSASNALYVPASAITTANGTSTVKVVKSGKTSTVTVKLGIVGDQGTQITSGLKDGETVVIGTVSASSGTTGTTGTGATGTGGAAGGGAGGAAGGGAAGGGFAGRGGAAGGTAGGGAAGGAAGGAGSVG
jgi:macrolide-specific efflux system membrane fusion protein